MKTGVELYKMNSEEMSGQLRTFESVFGCEVPPLYKAFISTFKLGRGERRGQKFLHPMDQNLQLSMGVLQFNGEHSGHIGLYDLYSVDECIQAKQNAFETNDKIWKQELVPIGECISNNILMLGVGQENMDQIYLENSNLFAGDKRLLFISNDIFEFIRNLWLKDDDEPGYGVNSYDKLYRNWGEDFWRVKS